MTGSPEKLTLLVGAGLVLATATLLTLVSVPSPHTGGDNASYLTLAHSLLEGEGYTELWDPETPPHTKYPPVYPLALALLMALGASSWGSFKLVSAAAISVAVLLTFAWAARRRGPLFGGGVALLVLLSAGWLQASRWILSEPLFLVWTLLALWAAERGLDAEDEGTPPGSRSSTLWLTLAGGATLLALFTRSAGLPLVVALLLALALARRWRALLIMSGVTALPTLLWGLRARRGGEGAYQDEFWMVNPYDPELGTVGLAGLLGRVWTNTTLYVGSVIPGEWWGVAVSGWGLAAFGVVLLLLALGGWVRTLRTRPGVAEFFLPLYLGLVLLWPEVWSGDRFVLVLYPLLLLYAGSLVLDGVGGRWKGGVAPVGAALLLALALPALSHTFTLAEEGSRCREVAERGDVFPCQGAGFVQFRDAAGWVGENLPDEAVVVNRKPSIFYALGGRRGRIFPFSQDPDELLRAADAMGARYLLLDRVDGIAGFYLVPAILSRPGAFCHLATFGPDPSTGTNLFGVLPPEERVGGGGGGEGVQVCGPGWMRSPPVEPYREGERIPLLGRRLSRLRGEAPAPPRRRGS